MGYGHVVILEHDEGVLSVYAHNQATLVRSGQQVKTGEAVARVGEGLRTSGPHLHFEVREKAAPKDPMRYLPPPR